MLSKKLLIPIVLITAVSIIAITVREVSAKSSQKSLAGFFDDYKNSEQLKRKHKLQNLVTMPLNNHFVTN